MQPWNNNDSSGDDDGGDGGDDDVVNVLIPKLENANEAQGAWE